MPNTRNFKNTYKQCENFRTLKPECFQKYMFKTKSVTYNDQEL